MNYRSRFNRNAKFLLVLLFGVVLLFIRDRNRENFVPTEIPTNLEVISVPHAGVPEIDARSNALGSNLQATATHFPLDTKFEPRMDAQHWIGVAETAIIPKFSYKVSVSSEVLDANEDPVDPVTLSKSTAQMRYSGDEGLRLESSEAAGSFSIDIASLLRETRGKMRWEYQTNEYRGSEMSVCVLSTTNRLSLKLWIRCSDGAVTEAEELIDGARVFESQISYARQNGVLLPNEVTTRLPRSGHVIRQFYIDYSTAEVSQ